MDRLKRLRWQIRDDLKKYRPNMFQTLMCRHGGQSRGTDSTIFARRHELCATSVP